MAFHAQHNQVKTRESFSNAKACRESIVRIPGRVYLVTCLLAETSAKIKQTNEGIEMLKEQIQEFPSQTKEKALCLMSLGKLCAKEGRASDAEIYYTQALDALVGMQQNHEHILRILECRIGISKALIMDNRVRDQAKKFLDEAFDSADELPASEKKVSFLEEIGELYRNCREIDRAQRCFDKALKTCKEESNVGKRLPVMEFKLELRLGDLAKKDGKKPAQRSHYDRAAEALRQHKATEQVNSSTIDLFLLLAVEYKSVDESEAIKLLLETLNVSEIVYGENKSNETITKILEQLSSMYIVGFTEENTMDYLSAALKYGERQLRMEMDLHSSNPFHEHISRNLTMLSFPSLHYRVSTDIVEHLFVEFLQNDKAPTNNTTKAAAARCFTSLGIMFYILGDLGKAETLNERASRLFGEIHESVEREKLPCETSCNIMKVILQSKERLPLQRKNLGSSIMEDMFKQLQSILDEDSNILENCRNGRENVEYHQDT
jgi:tetratricopeptide (TPR) repeat protein